jgi:septal ring factor EnvC (AmiA/AmiB activator)
MRTITRRFLPLILAVSVVLLIFAWIQLRIQHDLATQRADSLEHNFLDERTYLERLQTDNRALRQTDAGHQDELNALRADLKEQSQANAALRDRIRKLLASEIETQATLRANAKKIKRLRASQSPQP